MTQDAEHGKYCLSVIGHGRVALVASCLQRPGRLCALSRPIPPENRCGPIWLHFSFHIAVLNSTNRPMEQLSAGSAEPDIRAGRPAARFSGASITTAVFRHRKCDIANLRCPVRRLKGSASSAHAPGAVGWPLLVTFSLTWRYQDKTSSTTWLARMSAKAGVSSADGRCHR